MKPFIAVTVIAIILSFGALSSKGADSVMEIRATGSSKVRQGNLTQAKEAALDQALQNAVIQAVEQIVSPAAVSRNLQLLLSSAFIGGRKYIREYRVEAEAHSEALYAIVIRAAISEEDMAKALKETGLAPVQGEKKGILVFCEGEQYARLIMAEHLRDIAAALGFGMELIGPDFHDLSGLSIRTWADIGRQKDARFVLWCGLRLSCLDSGEGEKPCQGEALLKLVDADTYTLAASQSFTSQGSFNEARPGKEQIAENLSMEAARFLKERLTDYYLREAVAAQNLKVTVTGITRYTQYDQISRVLKNSVPGVEAVTLTSMGGGTFELDVRYRGNSEELRTKVLEQPYNGFQLISEASPEGSIAFHIESQSQSKASPETGMEQPQTWPPSTSGGTLP
jgi:hypothetical protein